MPVLEVVVIHKKLEALDICSFELAHPQGLELPAFSAGAHIEVVLANGMTRQYSLLGNPNRRDRYKIAVLRVTGSRGGSIAMHACKKGDRILISEPRNHFPLVDSAGYSILLAGGIGVTPLLCMAERLAHLGADFEFHYCVRSAERAAFGEYLQSRRFRDRVRMHFDDGPDHQRLDVPAVLGRVHPATHIYVCGPAGFMKYVLDHAGRLGWPAGNVHKEYFAAAAAASSQLADRAFAVEIASTGQIIEVPAGRTVVSVLAEYGIDVAVSCESGVCGTCLTGVKEGEPDHRDVFMNDAEHARNDRFTPCCSRAKSPLLVLDL